MLKKLYKKFFPLHSTGFDVSGDSLKFAELISTKDGIRLGKYGERKTQDGISEFGKIKKISPETKGQALARAVIKNNDPETYMILDLKENQTDIYIVSNGTVMFASDLGVGASDVLSLCNQISKYFLRWHTHNIEEDRALIKKIIICGDMPDPAGLVGYLSVSIKHPVELANVWTNILDIEKHVPGMTFSQSLSFAVAIGFALKNLE